MKKNVLILLLIVLVFVSYIPPIIALAFPRSGQFENGLACFGLGSFQNKTYTMCITTWTVEKPEAPNPDVAPMPHPVEG